MSRIIDVHDLPDEEVSLIQDFVEFLRIKLKKNSFKEEELKNKEWSKLAIASFSKDWENEKDAIYDNWEESYHASKR